MINRFKTTNPILDYDQVQDILIDLCHKGLKRQEPLCYTNSNIPIDYYTYGEGKNHIIMTGATHGCEIITTDFLLQFMDRILDNHQYDILKKDYTFHFVPVINPEGYIIATSAIRTVIHRDTSLHQTIKIARKYYKAYRKDDAYAKKHPQDTSPKLHQLMFAHADYDAIPDKYETLKKHFKETYEARKLPQGCMIIWSSNGNGIDPNANIPNHPRINKINLGKVEYGTLRYNNIAITYPGPLKCPNRVGIYVEEPETRAMNKLISAVKYQGNLNGILMFHSTWGKIFYEPYLGAEIDDDNRERINNIKAYNTKLARVYGNKALYDLIDNPGLYFYDENIRIKIPGTLLIELSKMGGNPIGPYGDLINYNHLIEDNFFATIAAIFAMPSLKKQYDDLNIEKGKDLVKKYTLNKERS